MSGVSHHNSLW